MASTSITSVVSKVHDLLEPLEPADRRKVMKAVFALFDDDSGSDFSNSKRANSVPEEAPEHGDLQLQKEARRWMRQNGISESDLLEVFDFSDGDVELIATSVPGNSKAAKTKACYLLEGVRSLLANDVPMVRDGQAIDHCHHFKCYDRANNSVHRSSLGLRGNKSEGFKLSAPLLQEAAKTVKEMAQT